MAPPGWEVSAFFYEVNRGPGAVSATSLCDERQPIITQTAPEAEIDLDGGAHPARLCSMLRNNLEDRGEERPLA